MTVNASLTMLTLRLKIVRDEFNSLRVMVIEDSPIEGDVALTGIMGDTLDDLVGWLDEGLTVLDNLGEPLAYPVNRGNVQQALTETNILFDRVIRRFFSELVQFKSLAQLLSLGKRQGPEWLTWARGVRKRLELCYQPLFEANQAFGICWQELSEYGSVMSVNTVNITHSNPASSSHSG